MIRIAFTPDEWGWDPKNIQTKFSVKVLRGERAPTTPSGGLSPHRRWPPRGSPVCAEQSRRITSLDPSPASRSRLNAARSADQSTSLRLRQPVEAQEAAQCPRAWLRLSPDTRRARRGTPDPSRPNVRLNRARSHPHTRPRRDPRPRPANGCGALRRGDDQDGGGGYRAAPALAADALSYGGSGR